MLLETQSDGALCAVALTYRDAYSAHANPDVALIDAPACNGLECIQRLRARAPELSVFALVDETLEHEVLAYAHAGVAGFFTAAHTPEQVVAALQNGAPYVDSSIDAILLRALAHPDPQDAPNGQMHLTPREVQVLNLIDTGLSNKEIATALRVELATVKNHVHQILTKTHSRRRAQAAHIVRAHVTPGHSGEI